MGAKRAFLGAAFVVVSGVSEELVCRAYLITRLQQLGATKVVAVAASVVLLAACHLYLGPVDAVRQVPGSLLASVYYVRYRNATVIILAHLYYNALVLL